MTVTPGSRLGVYTIGAPLGAGGMGEVYRATDHNLGCDVAIKVLPAAFTQDAERLARFEREARTLATLNHPNIAIIHGLEHLDGVRALTASTVASPPSTGSTRREWIWMAVAAAAALIAIALGAA